jgi:hypothetical protein
MAVTELYYRERAAEARLQAGEANLDNVRDRCLRSAAAWDVMAARVGRTARLRVATEAKKAAERAAAALIVAEEALAP